MWHLEVGELGWRIWFEFLGLLMLSILIQMTEDRNCWWFDANQYHCIQMLSTDADICLYLGGGSWMRLTLLFLVIVQRLFSPVWLSAQCFTTPLILLFVYRSHVLTLYGQVLLLCFSSKEDVPAIKPNFYSLLIVSGDWLRRWWSSKAGRSALPICTPIYKVQNDGAMVNTVRLQRIKLREINQGSKHKHG